MTDKNVQHDHLLPSKLGSELSGRENQRMNSAIEKRKKLKQTVVWYVTLALSEVTGTALLLFFACIGAVPNIAEPPTHLRISMGAGSAVAVALQIFGHISGGHINPTVTIAAMIYKLVTITQGVIYIVSQFIGAILGYGLLLILVPDESLETLDDLTNTTHHGFCVTMPNPKLSLVQALFIEYFASSILVFICWAIWDKRSHATIDFVAIRIGGVVFGLVLVFGDYTGPSLNTARTFAPAIFTGMWEDHWIYWLAPISASVITSIFYKYTFFRFRNPNEQETDQP